MLQELAKQEHLEVEVEFVESAQNKADTLTCMPRKWLAQPKDKETPAVAASCVEVTDGLHSQAIVIHLRHHFGTDWTLEFARRGLSQHVYCKLVKAVISDCRQCACINPALIFKWEKGVVATGSVWQKYVQQRKYVCRCRRYLQKWDHPSHL